ncbi:MAG: AEC family transporter [Achromobacter sp.]
MLAITQFYLSAIVLMLPLLFCVGIGVFWGKRDIPFGGAFITTLVTSVTTPALVFHTFVTTHLDDRALADVAAATLLALLLCALVAALLLKVCKLPVRTLLPTAFLPNAGNLGLPISQLAFGDAGLSVAVAFFAVNSFVMHTIAVRLLPGVNTKGSWKSPILLASVVAVGLRMLHIPVPEWLIETARMLGAVTVPLMLLSLGHALALIPSNGLRDGAKVGAIRLGVGLAAGLTVVWALDLEPVLAGALTLQMAMPCAVVSYMYAKRYTPLGDTAAGAVLVSTVVFLLLAPLMLWFTRAGA